MIWSVSLDLPHKTGKQLVGSPHALHRLRMIRYKPTVFDIEVNCRKIAHLAKVKGVHDKSQNQIEAKEATHAEKNHEQENTCAVGILSRGHIDIRYIAHVVHYSDPFEKHSLP